MHGAWVGVGDSDVSPDELEVRRLYGYSRNAHGASTATDEEGRFDLDGVPVGFVRLWAGKKDHLSSYTNPVEVRVATPTHGVTIRLDIMPKDRLIEGVVLSPDGDPVPHANLRYS